MMIASMNALRNKSRNKVPALVATLAKLGYRRDRRVSRKTRGKRLTTCKRPLLHHLLDVARPKVPKMVPRRVMLKAAL
jgi:hypothetical protein